MQLKVIYDGTLLSSAPRNLSQSFTGGQYLYFDPQLGENLALMIGVAWLIKLPGVNGDLLKVWETSNSLDTDVIIPIPREVSESGYELYCSFGTSVDQPNFRAYVIYSNITQESLAGQLGTLQADVDLILQNQTTSFTLESALAANALAQNTALTILGTGLAPISAGVTAGVVPVLAGSQLLLLLPG
jgi:hypothetical protein